MKSKGSRGLFNNGIAKNNRGTKKQQPYKKFRHSKCLGIYTQTKTNKGKHKYVLHGLLQPFLWEKDKNNAKPTDNEYCYKKRRNHHKRFIIKFLKEKAKTW
jgi:hypothetical protein